MENFSRTKYNAMVVLIMPIVAVLGILLFAVFPVWFITTALEKEAEEKGDNVERVIDLDFIDQI